MDCTRFARRVAAIAAALGCLFLVDTAYAQNAASIAGAVKDATGAVLPGATVEASSPALIEKVRSVASDSNGEYKIVDLRPGVYAVTVTLPGFSTFKREGIELTSGFTANVTATLTVGSVEETITVTSSTPVVDVQNARTQSVLKAEVLDALPTGMKNIMQIASMTLGAVNSTAGMNDVGGDKGEQATGMSMHGGRGFDGRANWDGMNLNMAAGNGGGNSRVYFHNVIAMQEIVVDTGGAGADTETAGANLNMVPKDGGNRSVWYGAVAYSNSDFSASTIPDSLAARGIGPQASLKRTYDYGIGKGGAFKQDKLWYYATSRWWGAGNYAASNFFNASTNPFVYVPDRSRPAYSDPFFVDTSLRLTWQAARKHKLTQEEHLQNGCRCWASIGSGALTSPEAGFEVRYGPQVLSQTTWNDVASNRLLLQAAASFLRQYSSYFNGDSLNANRVTGLSSPVFPGPDVFSIVEANTGYRWGTLGGALSTWGKNNNDNTYSQRASLSYVTGSHSFKSGVQTQQFDYDYSGMPLTVNQVNYTFRGGLPLSLSEFAGPFQSVSRLWSLGVYAQDQWTLKKLTLNLGLRFDQFNGKFLAQDVPAGPFRAAFSVPDVKNVPNFKDISPRLGAAYDVFGNGKTAIKGAFGRYVFSQGAALSQNGFAPSVAIVSQVTRTWTDTNGNFTPDCTLVNPLANGECGQISNLRFGQPVSNFVLDPSTFNGWGKREYDYQTSVQLQQELRPGLGLNVGYFRTWWGNQLVGQNTLVMAGDYSPFCVTAPTDSRLGDTSGQQICGYYDINPARFGQSNTLLTRAKDLGLGSPKEVYNGFEVAANARWGKGALINGGLSIGRESVDYCYANGHPELLPENFPNVNFTGGGQLAASSLYPRNDAYCKVTSPWWNAMGSQAKVQVVYPLPLDFQVSGVFKTLPGVPVVANQVVTAAQTTLGRNFAAGAAATSTVALIPFGSNGDTTQGTLFDQRLNETDLRVTKIFRFGSRRLQGMLDLYNVFNNRSPQGISTTYSAPPSTTFMRPSSLLGGRLLKFGATFDF